MPVRGMGNFRILDRSWLRNSNNRPRVRSVRTPTVAKVLRYGSGWIEVQLSDGTRQRREGGTLSWRYVNPGNLKYGKFARAHKSVGKGWGSHAVFPDYATGRWAKSELLFGRMRSYYKLSLKRAIAKYAPPSDNNRPDIYTRFLVRRVKGINENTILSRMNPQQREQLLDAMQTFEGYKVGKIVQL